MRFPVASRGDNTVFTLINCTLEAFIFSKLQADRHRVAIVLTTFEKLTVTWRKSNSSVDKHIGELVKIYIYIYTRVYLYKYEKVSFLNKTGRSEIRNYSFVQIIV